MRDEVVGGRRGYDEMWVDEEGVGGSGEREREGM